MADEYASLSNVAGESSESTVLLSTFKDKIATDVGLPVRQQRLIFRGKVLKDEHRLSEYHVESGDMLHLVARQLSESQPSSGSSTGTTANANTGQDANAAGSRHHVAHVSHSVVHGTFGGGHQNSGGVRAIMRVISAVLDSFGVEEGSVLVPLPNMQFNIPRQAAQGNEAGVNVNNQSQPGNPSQSAPQGMQFPLGAGIAIPTLAMALSRNGTDLGTITSASLFSNDSLSEIFFLALFTGYQPNQPSNGAEHSPTIELPSSARGVPLPAALAVHTAGRLEEEESCTDPMVRTQIQSEATQSGLAMQHLGALLLELGRTMLTLRIGQSPPFPLQTNSLFGGNVTPINSTGFHPVGIGAVPRHINVHIHAVNLQSRRADDSTRSENQASAEGTENATSSSSATKSANDMEGASSSSTVINNSGNASTAPLGLG
ncbi:hypothetical protein L1987_76562 [Smallanthus sonchifolius]|uniref:Uncharacterized protein n=1 Tax=Smallanthus sonchifolius TaxID=185202 RepID=A0ACB8Z6N7_9ASTR|nr:hypothetical protein L1987_76562 [Smallanthus sonchifolius]